MAEWQVAFTSRRGWTRVVLAALGVVAVVAGMSALPGLLFGIVLTPAEAETSIRGHLAAQAALELYRESAGAGPQERARLEAAYQSKVDALKALKFASVDVDTVIFSFFRIRRSFVVKVVSLGPGARPADRYFGFVGKVLTSECAKWQWLLAW